MLSVNVQEPFLLLFPVFRSENILRNQNWILSLIILLFICGLLITSSNHNIHPKIVRRMLIHTFRSRTNWSNREIITKTGTSNLRQRSRSLCFSLLILYSRPPKVKLFLGHPGCVLNFILPKTCHPAKNSPRYFSKSKYRIYSNKRRGAYFIFRATSVALIRGRRLFE